MKTSSWIALVAIVVLQFGSAGLPSIDLGDWLRKLSPDAGPVVPAPKEPTAELQELVRPIGQKLAEDDRKAAIVASAFAGYADATGGPAGKRIKTAAQWGQIVTIATESINVRGGIPVGAEIRDAVMSHVGIEVDPDDKSLGVDRPLTESDRTKIVEVYRAIAWAASTAGTKG